MTTLRRSVGLLASTVILTGGLALAGPTAQAAGACDAERTQYEQSQRRTAQAEQDERDAKVRLERARDRYERYPKPKVKKIVRERRATYQDAKAETDALRQRTAELEERYQLCVRQNS